MSVVSDATPLISLTAIGALDLLAQLFGTILIPQTVYHEVVIAGAGKPGAQAVANAAWIQTRVVRDRRAVKALMNNGGLDQGESEALVLAQELQATLLLLDDLAARQLAQQMPITGTLGVLLLAKRQGLIPLVRPYLDALLAAGSYLDQPLYQLVIQLAGE